jgi:hypothetical protein
MTELKFLSAALIAAAMLATPAMARESHVSSRHLPLCANAAPRPEPIMLAKETVCADAKATMCGATEAPTMDLWFPRFHDPSCRDLLDVRHAARDEMIGKAFYCCGAWLRSWHFSNTPMQLQTHLVQHRS